jgi:hypothetical protein
MRMLSIFDGIFWGLFFIVIGVWIMIRGYIPVHIPLIRVILALLFVWLGVRILIKGPEIRDSNTTVFSDSHVQFDAESRGNDYNVIFGRGYVDLSRLAPAGGGSHKEVNVIFGSGILHINPEVPTRIDMSSAFGTVVSPNGNSVAFGNMVYTTPSYREGADALRIKATAVFGRLRIED